MINFLIYLTFIFFSFGQLFRISFFNQQINFYLYEIFLFLTFIYLFFSLGFEPIKAGYKNFKIIYGFVIFLFFSYFLDFAQFSPFQNLIAFLYLLRLIFYFVFWGYWIYFLKKKSKFQLVFTKAIFIFAGLISIGSFLQYVFYPDLRNLWYLGWDPHFARMFGSFFDTSIAGAIYGLMFLYFLINYHEYKKNKYYKITGLIFILIFLMASALTFSRSTYLVLSMIMFYYFFSGKKIARLFVFLTIFLLIVFLAPKPYGEGVNLARLFSVKARMDDYKKAVEIWKDKPLFGIGYNRIRFFKEEPEMSHAASSFSSSYLIMLVCGGITGLLLFLGTLIKLLFINEKIGIFILFTMLLSLSDNIILHPFILFLLGVVILSLSNLLFDKSLKK